VGGWDVSEQFRPKCSGRSYRVDTAILSYLGWFKAGVWRACLGSFVQARVALGVRMCALQATQAVHKEMLCMCETSSCSHVCDLVRTGRPVRVLHSVLRAPDKGVLVHQHAKFWSVCLRSVCLRSVCARFRSVCLRSVCARFRSVCLHSVCARFRSVCLAPVHTRVCARVPHPKFCVRASDVHS